MRGDKPRRRDNIRCPNCGSYNVLPFIKLNKQKNMCQKCGLIFENAEK